MELMYGRNSLQPLDAVLSKEALTRVSAVRPLSQRAKEHVAALTEALSSMHTAASKGGEQRRKQNQLQAEKRGIEPHANFSVGDFVLAARVEPDKLSVRWAGPMRVVRVLSNWTFEVEDLVRGRRAIRHARMLRLFADQALDVTEELRRQIQHDDGAWFVVSEIRDWRKQPRKPVELLVRWEGFDDDSDSWEPIASLYKDVPVIVRDFVSSLDDIPRTLPLREALARLG